MASERNSFCILKTLFLLNKTKNLAIYCAYKIFCSIFAHKLTTMEKLQITETSMELAKQWDNSGVLEDDLLLLEHMSEVR